MIIVSAIAGETWIALRKLRSIQATPVMAQTMIMAGWNHWIGFVRISVGLKRMMSNNSYINMR